MLAARGPRPHRRGARLACLSSSPPHPKAASATHRNLRDAALGDMTRLWTCRGERPSEVSSSLMGDLSPAWKMTLLSDGSVTRHVELLTAGEVRVECLEMRAVSPGDLPADLVPEEALGIAGPVVQRQVLLYTEADPEFPLVYAASWWNKSKADAFLTDVDSPIWVNLSDNKTELFREIRALYGGRSAGLEERFGAEGPFWGRHYCFWHDGGLLCVIYEAFSSKLDDYLSDACR